MALKKLKLEHQAEELQSGEKGKGMELSYALIARNLCVAYPILENYQELKRYLAGSMADASVAVVRKRY